MPFTDCRQHWMPPSPQCSGALLALALVLGIFALGGCSTEAWFEGAKRSAEAQCRQQPPGAVQECLSRVNKTRYDQYEKERTGSK